MEPSEPPLDPPLQPVLYIADSSVNEASFLTNLVPSPMPSFSSHAVRKSGEGLVHFLVRDVKSRKSVDLK